LKLHTFTSDRQRRVFDGVLTELGRLGYSGELLQQAYDFNDWFVPNAPARQAAAAGFGRKPLGYDSACVAAFLSSPDPKISLLGLRALGAPFAIEVRDDGVVPWSVGVDETTTHQSTGGRIPADAMRHFFDAIKTKWSPDTVLRAKNIGQSVGPTEIDWVDLGLIPALENEISQKLDRLLRNALIDGQRAYKGRTGQKPQSEELYRLVFRLLAGKVFHDRKVGGFDKIDGAKEPNEILSKVSDYYKEPHNYLGGREAQLVVASHLWSKLSFQNLSVDVLAFIYENTLVDNQLRKEGGIHSTPHRIARYVVEHLPWAEIPQSERIVLEPCSGHGVFLVAALKRLRDLLGTGWSNRESHDYLIRMLNGFERDPFAREVSKLCLMLADFPNPNGWKLEVADVFSSRKFVEALPNARVLLCNPPFEDFKTTERQRYAGRVAPQKPLELLKRIFSYARRDVVMGLVLPQQFLTGVSYRGVREELARRYREIDLVTLPDKVFTHAEMETVLVMAHGAKQPEQSTTVNFAEVRQRELKSFMASGRVTRQDRGSFDSTAAGDGLWVSTLQEIWERLQHLPKLGDIAEIHRGVEWKPPFKEEKYVSNAKRGENWILGLKTVEDGLQSFCLPSPVYLNADPKTKRGGAWDLPWNKPKIVANAVRKARGSWRIAAAYDLKGFVCTQAFQCVWPKECWSLKSLTAVLNSPVVSAFAATHESSKHIKIVTMAECRIPALSPAEMATLERYVDDLMATLSNQPEVRYELWGGDSWQDRARNILLQIDALILRAYNLPPWIERKLLDFFRGEKRPVPFQFGDYYPQDFSPTLPLWLYVSPNFANCRGSHILQTIPKFDDPKITDALEEVS
jgi:hypothetical protein